MNSNFEADTFAAGPDNNEQVAQLLGQLTWMKITQEDWNTPKVECACRSSWFRVEDKESYFSDPQLPYCTYCKRNMLRFVMKKAAPGGVSL
jgi:hypothetical protein